MSISRNVALLNAGDTSTFEYLGDGCTRVAYLKDGFVYKVLIDPEWDVNEAEYENYLRLVDILPVGWEFPITDYRDGIIVQEYVTGETIHNCNCYWYDNAPCDLDPCPSKMFQAFKDEFNINDLGGNVIYTGTAFCLFDIVC